MYFAQLIVKIRIDFDYHQQIVHMWIAKQCLGNPCNSQRSDAILFLPDLACKLSKDAPKTFVFLTTVTEKSWRKDKG